MAAFDRNYKVKTSALQLPPQSMCSQHVFYSNTIVWIPVFAIDVEDSHLTKIDMLAKRVDIEIFEKLNTLNFMAELDKPLHINGILERELYAKLQQDYA